MKDKDEESVGYSMQDKTMVLQEARVFNETPINPRKCRQLLTMILYLIDSGETFTTEEATDLFFSVTKLFQHRSTGLRQMVYLTIKELAGSASDVIMVTSSIMKDMQPDKETLYRPNAMRALARVIDPGMMHQLERFFKAGILDQNPVFASASLVSALHLYPLAKDVVKRWANVILESAQKNRPMLPAGVKAGATAGALAGSSTTRPVMLPASHMTEYHALGLLYLIRREDRIAVTKLISQFASPRGVSPLKNSLALTMLVRFAAKVLEDDPNMAAPMLELLEAFLDNKRDMVALEAARAICGYKGVTPALLAKPVVVLKNMLLSPKSAIRFAAVRSLTKVALVHPSAVQSLNVEIERLVNDENRSVATFAITTLLKTGSEASVDRLVKQLVAFMSEITDEFKIVVVDAIRALCLKFPQKQPSMLSFLSTVLRDEGGYEFKKAVVEAIFDMIRFIEDSKDSALAQLCEFIEDCEFTRLSVRVLHLLGLEGPKAPQPSKYIRYIYNRVVLENAMIRAAAVSALAKFAHAATPGSQDRTSILSLLKRCLSDTDDEVRDRAATSLTLLGLPESQLPLVQGDTRPSLNLLEASLVSYIDANDLNTPFDASKVPWLTRDEAHYEASQLKPRLESAAPFSKEDAAAAPADEAAQPADEPADDDQLALEAATTFSQTIEFADYGRPLKTTKPQPLTDLEAEYIVHVRKHIFDDHIVVQFDVRNTVDVQQLDNVSLLLSDYDTSQLSEDFILSIPQLPPGASATGYVSFSKHPGSFPITDMAATLQFQSREVDPDSGFLEPDGYDDSFQVEPLSVAPADYFKPTYAVFDSDWARPDAGEIDSAGYDLSAVASIQEVIDSLLAILGLQPCGDSAIAPPSKLHELKLSGSFVDGAKVLVLAKMFFQPAQGVKMQLSVKSLSDNARALVLAAIE